VTPQLVIFDCDGVLIDSEAISARVLIASVSRLGIEIDFDTFCQRYVGRSFPTVAKDIFQMFDVALPDGFEADYRATLLTAFEAELIPTMGIVDVLDAMKLPYCVATSSSPPRVARSLALTGLAGFFGNRVYTASQVTRGKPAPDLFVFAATKMGVDPSACLVIEDSLPGIHAGIAAGMTVLRYTGGAHLQGRTLKHDQTVPTFDNWADFSVLMAKQP